MADARRAPLKDQTDISGARALIVEARFYDDLQDALLDGAVAELKAAGLTHAQAAPACKKAARLACAQAGLVRYRHSGTDSVPLRRARR